MSSQTPQYDPKPWRFEAVDPEDFSGMGAWPGAFSINSGKPDTVKEVYVGFALSEANARLIAAAPELLEALMKLEEGFAHEAENGLWDADYILDQIIRPAIAKAEGGEG